MEKQEPANRAGCRMALDKEAVIARARQERRRFQRVAVDFKGHLFLPEEDREVPCTIVAMSAGGAQVTCEAIPEPQSNVVLYIDGFGRFEATVARTPKTESDEGTFGVRFNCTALKRERIAEQLTLYVSNGTIDQTALRRHERTTAGGFARFTRATGDIVNCKVLDLSLGGVSLATEVRPQIGELVLIGQMAGRVARIHENGIAIEFVTAPPEKTAADQPPKLSALR